ncbi:MAG: Hsp70 family protein, partial [Ktedonobacteraceae bacterium]|nr:Hsp70 family protein [Ktedonobacteraceae bacterium]
AAYRSEKSLSELGDKITSEQKSELETKIADVRAALAGDDIERIRSSREALEQAFYRISESLYRQQGEPSASDYSGGEQPSSGDTDSPRDDTIEGEYKEM